MDRAVVYVREDPQHAAQEQEPRAAQREASPALLTRWNDSLQSVNAKFCPARYFGQARPLQFCFAFLNKGVKFL